MKKYYCLAVEVNHDYEDASVFSSTQPFEEKEFIVIPNYRDEPVTAQVIKLISEHEAVIKHRYHQEIIDRIDMKAYHAKQQADVSKKILTDKMKDKIEEIKNLELLEKYAGKDDDMADLLKEFKELKQPSTATEEITPID